MHPFLSVLAFWLFNLSCLFVLYAGYRLFTIGASNRIYADAYLGQRRWYARLLFAKDQRIERIMLEIQERGKRAGFRVPSIPVLVVRSWIPIVKAQAMLTGIKLEDTRIIVWPKGYKTRLDRRDLEVVLAHEYGHVVDYFMGRQNHPFTRRIAGLSQEDFADMISSYLFSVQQGAATSAKHQLRFNLELARKLEITRTHVVWDGRA